MVRDQAPAALRDPVSRGLSRSLHRAHDEFLATGRVDAELRPEVVESWRRSLSRGLDPERSLAPVLLADDALEEIRTQHPLAPAMPVIRRLLADSATDAGLLVAVSDAAGQLLWVEGPNRLRSRAESMNFMPGADWSEGSAGTNAPGTALALDRPMQILGAEHLVRPVTDWSCTAAPIHDPQSGAILGVLDLTGGPEVVTTQTLSLVRATVAAVEAELRLERLARYHLPTLSEQAVDAGRSRLGTDQRMAVAGWCPDRPRLQVLGRRAARLSHRGTVTDLSVRHSELVLLVARCGDGATAEELAVQLSEDDLPTVTVRAELSRLRALLAPLTLASRPYRFEEAVDTDIDVVRAELAAGRLRRAVAAYPGPVLPRSGSPAVIALREELHDLLRSALLAADDADALLTFADTDHGRRDLDVWQAAVEVLPRSSPRYAQVRRHLERLDRELS